MTTSSETWLEQLHDHGYRVTAARRAVVDTVFGTTHALTPSEVYDTARKKYRALGLVTVYRTLEKLEELHLIQRVHQPLGCQAFIAAGIGHQHLLLCQQCVTKSIARKTGYQIQEHWLQLFGLCTNCK
ncbi:MAG: transcriptional repressor [Chloroflexi bacterium]|nr:transcriptional repressor [Chloroflexota bacterium]